jgi:2-polyprenyl-3-methyl-5-hydroxy-6-metoxy-1,4-benzoquinol methylase
MDARTVSFYSANAKDVADRYESVQSPLAGYFSTVFSPGGKILDIGCGSGRDMAELTRQGYSAYGIDATPEFVQLAQALHPELTGRVSQAVLPDFEVPFGGNFDGVLCSAVLMHIDTADLLTAALSIKRCLKVNGRLLLSVPSHRSDVSETERDSTGRLFKSHTAADLSLIFEGLGFTLIDQWKNQDAMDRHGVEWVTVVFRLLSTANTIRANEPGPLSI